MNIVWLASYPKSGNTWLGLFLYHYFFGIPEKSTVVQEHIPDIHSLLASGKGLNADNPNTIMCKTHFLYSEKHPYINNSIGFIYLLRHPKDVLLSSINFHRLCSESGEADEPALAQEFIREMGGSDYIKWGMGGWAEHVGSWLTASRQRPHLFLRYEDLRLDPETNFRRVIGFLGEKVNEDRLQQAIDKTSFKSMRKLEMDEKKNKISTIFPGSRERKIYFVNKGGVGQDLKHISNEIDQQFNERFAQAMDIFGY